MKNLWSQQKNYGGTTFTMVLFCLLVLLTTRTDGGSVKRIDYRSTLKRETKEENTSSILITGGQPNIKMQGTSSFDSTRTLPTESSSTNFSLGATAISASGTVLGGSSTADPTALVATLPTTIPPIQNLTAGDHCHVEDDNCNKSFHLQCMSDGYPPFDDQITVTETRCACLPGLLTVDVTKPCGMPIGTHAFRILSALHTLDLIIIIF